MLKEREIKLSLRDRLTTLFTSETSGIFQQPWNIYNEIQYRDALAGTFAPTHPYLYLLDDYLPAMGLRADVMQPSLTIEVDYYSRRPFEAGNRSGRYVEIFFQILGRNRGERDDIASFIVDHFGDSVPIKSYATATDTGTLVENALIVPANSSGDLFIKEDMFTARQSSLADDTELSGQLLGWGRCRFSFICKV